MRRNPVAPPHGMDRRRHRAAGRAAAWQILCHRRAADARAWPASRPGARRRRLADAAVAAAGNSVTSGVAGPARRASRHLRDRRHAARAATAAGVLARGLWRHPSGLAGAAVAGARSARGHLQMLDRTLDDFDDAGGAAATSSGSNSRCWPNSASASIWKNCAATGETADLIYVSPKSGAVSRRAGEPYRDRLRLPAFLREGEGGRTAGRTRTCRTVSADRAVPAPPRAGAARAGPFRRRDGFINAVTKIGAQISSVSPRFAPSTSSSLRTQGPCRGPSIGAAAPAIFRHKHLWLRSLRSQGRSWGAAPIRLARFSRKV